MNVVYDAAVLIAADRDDRKVWADHRARLEAGVIPQTTAPVVAQASRTPRQPSLRRFLAGCDVLPFAISVAHEVGGLLGRARADDVVDGHVVLVAAASGATVVTSDVTDLRRLARWADPPVRVSRL